jgi:peptidoglycan hydrolase FlgJ
MALTLDKLPDDPLRTQRSTSRVDANDFKRFDKLRANADSPEALREVARQFEAIFTKMMLESMRAASFGDPLFGSDQGDMYQDMMDDQLAIEMSQGKGLGLADMLIRQLSHGANMKTPGELGEMAVGEKALPLTSRGRAAPDDAAKQTFIDRLLPAAEKAAQALGVDPRAIIAQAALETGWGRSTPGDAAQGESHNHFGIKAGASWRGESVRSATTEFDGDVAGTEVARFRAYENAEASVADYVSLLRDNPRYAAALGTGGDVRAFATALQRGGYATDPDYANKLDAVARQVAEQLDRRQDLAASLKAGHAAPLTEQS